MSFYIISFNRHREPVLLCALKVHARLSWFFSRDRKVHPRPYQERLSYQAHFILILLNVLSSTRIIFSSQVVTSVGAEWRRAQGISTSFSWANLTNNYFTPGTVLFTMRSKLRVMFHLTDAAPP